MKGYTDRFELYQQLIATEHLDKLTYLEFGVSKGESMNWWLTKNKHADSRFYGFDTFEGIPEDWGTKPKGSYSNQGDTPPTDDSRCTFIKGLFQENLYRFLKDRVLNERLVIHFDADLYTSTLYCLFAIHPHLKQGDLLIFDEFDITTHEFRAFHDYKVSSAINCVCIGESNNYNKVVFKIA